MPAWNELLTEFEQHAPEARGDWFAQKFNSAVQDVSTARGGKNVVLYGSAFLQKPNLPQGHILITHEDINGFMSVIRGMDWDAGLSLVLHTPGGVTNATESLVDYLRAKFADFEVIVPTYAMSAGTMISLASDRIVMARHSQLGPIDPQMLVPGGGSFPAQAIKDQFDQAKVEIAENPVLAHAWAPVLAPLGPAMLRDAVNNPDYSERMVRNWLAKYMLAGDDAKAKEVAHYFADNTEHLSHGRRIGRDEARDRGVVVEDLETSQATQEAVLTLYHLMTIWFDQSTSTKVMWSLKGQWIKNWGGSV